MRKKKKSKNQKIIIQAVKAARQKSREEEISLHGKPVNYQKIVQSKKIYTRKNKKNYTDEL